MGNGKSCVVRLGGRNTNQTPHKQKKTNSDIRDYKKESNKKFGGGQNYKGKNRMGDYRMDKEDRSHHPYNPPVVHVVFHVQNDILYDKYKNLMPKIPPKNLRKEKKVNIIWCEHHHNNTHIMVDFRTV